MAFHGDADPIVTYEGGGLNATTIANQQYWKGEMPDGLPVHGGVDQALADWAAHNGCDPEPVEERISPEVLRRTWAGCEADDGALRGRGWRPHVARASRSRASRTSSGPPRPTSTPPP